MAGSLSAKQMVSSSILPPASPLMREAYCGDDDPGFYHTPFNVLARVLNVRRSHDPHRSADSGFIRVKACW